MNKNLVKVFIWQDYLAKKKGQTAAAGFIIVCMTKKLKKHALTKQLFWVWKAKILQYKLPFVHKVGKIFYNVFVKSHAHKGFLF